MKKWIYIFVLLVSMQFTVFAKQDGPGQNIQNLKIGFVSRQLSLTSDEAQRFWPVYNDYTNELRKARKEQKDDVLGFEEQALNIRKKYKSEFKKILGSDERVNRTLTADRDFNNVLKKEWQRRMQMRGGRKDLNKKDGR
jgi:Skp family chaperone for outer membrane proteins